MGNKTISCNCQVKTNLSSDNESTVILTQYNDIKIESNFGIIKCYNLVFSLKGKINNIGFWIFLFLILIHIPFLIIFFYKGLEPIKEYILNEMANNGYISNNSNNKTKIKKIHKRKSIKVNSPIKKTNRVKKKVNNKGNKKRKKVILKDNSSFHNLKLKEGKIKHQINSNNKEIPSKDLLFNNNKINSIHNKTKIKTKKNKKRLSLKGKKIINNDKILSTSQINNINQLQTYGEIENNNNNKENNIFGFNLININLNNDNKEYIPKNSNIILNNYTFEEAIKYDMRSLLLIFYIFLLSKQVLFHAFLFKSPLEIFAIRFCLLIFIISSDLALNSIFYLDDKISEKYKYAKNIFLFAFNNNITVILLSTLIGFIFLTFFTKLSNSTYAIREVFRKEEEKLKNNNKYIVDDIRKKEIFEEITKILNNFRIKIIIFIIFEFLIVIFFWYYITAFCHVYSSTQTSWILDSFLSMISRIIIDCLISLGFAKLYRISVESNVRCIYKFVLFFYSFG